MNFGGLITLTLLDYPEKVACTVFTVGCNFRCPFCHNGGMVFGTNCENLTEWDVISFLQKRKHILEGVCLTGGEPLIHPEAEDFLRKVKTFGYSVKLDTNGSFPERLIGLVEKGLVDYVAMDVKNSQARYHETVGGSFNLKKICQSVEFLKQGNVDYEFRTTVTGNFHDEQSMEEMGQWLAGAKRLYLQKFEPSDDLIDKNTFGCDEQTLVRYKNILKKYVPETHLRGTDDI